MTNPRMKFLENLNAMWDIFKNVSHTPEDDKAIERFIEAKDDCHSLLSSICTKGLSDCMSCQDCEKE